MNFWNSQLNNKLNGLITHKKKLFFEKANNYLILFPTIDER